MKKVIWSAVLVLCLLFSLAGCAAQPPEPTAQSMAKEPTEIFREESPEGKTAAPDGIGFRYFYRGFTPVSLDDRAAMEAFQQIGMKLILDEDSWHDYMGRFCPGIPYYESVDYSRECLLTSVVLGARPPYAIAQKRISLRVENGCFASEYDENPSNWVYALNGDDTAHFYVEVMIISREDIPADIEGMIYHP